MGQEQQIASDLDLARLLDRALDRVRALALDLALVQVLALDLALAHCFGWVVFQPAVT